LQKLTVGQNIYYYGVLMILEAMLQVEQIKQTECFSDDIPLFRLW